MKKHIGTIKFLIILSVIIVLDLLLYKNIDLLIPMRENEVLAYENDLQEEKEDFIYEIFNQINEKLFFNSSNVDQNTINELKNNEIIFNILKECVFNIEDYDENELELIMAEIISVTRLDNTKYGNLNAITTFGNSAVILYSDDMDKIYYYKEINFYEENENYEIVESDDGNFIKIVDKDETNKKMNKEEIINNVKNTFSNLVKDYEFEPDTIMYKEDYYILKDSLKDITVYYYAEKDIIFGFYLGFGE
jgi:hypothetical protein